MPRWKRDKIVARVTNDHQKRNRGRQNGARGGLPHRFGSSL